MFLTVLALTSASLISASDNPARRLEEAERRQTQPATQPAQAAPLVRLQQLMQDGQTQQAWDVLTETQRSADYASWPVADKARLKSAQGRLLYARGSLQQSEMAFWNLAELCEKGQLGVSCSLAAANSLLAIYLENGHADRAERALKLADGLDLATLPRDHQEVLRLISNRCVVSMARRHLTEAEQFCRQALTEWNNSPHRNSIDEASVRNNLGLIFLRQGKFPDAITMLSAGVALMQQQGDSARGHRAVPMANLASANARVGRVEDAESIYRDSMRLAEEELGPTHPTTAHVMLQFSGFLARTKHRDEAKQLRAEAQRILETHEQQSGLRNTVDARLMR